MRPMKDTAGKGPHNRWSLRAIVKKEVKKYRRQVAKKEARQKLED